MFITVYAHLLPRPAILKHLLLLALLGFILGKSQKDALL